MNYNEFTRKKIRRKEDGLNKEYCEGTKIESEVKSSKTCTILAQDEM